MEMDDIRDIFDGFGLQMSVLQGCCDFPGCKDLEGTSRAEVHFFPWLAVHGKLLRADNLAIRGWPNDPICKLCRIHPETIQHLQLECSFSAVVKEKIFTCKGTIGVAPLALGLGLNE